MDYSKLTREELIALVASSSKTRSTGVFNLAHLKCEAPVLYKGLDLPCKIKGYSVDKRSAAVLVDVEDAQFGAVKFKKDIASLLREDANGLSTELIAELVSVVELRDKIRLTMKERSMDFDSAVTTVQIESKPK